MQGAEIYGTATTEKGAANIGNALAEAGIPGAGLVLDLTQGEAVEILVAELGRREAMPDILVNNAGITRDKLLLRMDEKDWDEVVTVNLKSVYQLSKACMREMSRQKWGRIINLTSVSALCGNAGQCNYAAAKAGIIGFTKSLAHELAARGVTVNCIAPGFIDTDMTRILSDEQHKALNERIPVKRFGTPDEVAHAVAMLAAPDAAYITGETVCVSGGLYM